ncbi:aminotransferase class V-fold PLP-dependent enzyme [Helicobacter sp. MIT 05-5294]|uniref:aminotransferase class V-fold PLP-dependent enzyme n=1 Tax=Helicobacter sp. MIT 05-5294 TaxID=1548150 RepID=UPI000AE24508|nr:aminotransferase class V-fold PLP-dependent enzyme [Helicobacter sp. MIT 05-5294]TLD89225.1 aminotransferase class V-fold PLP-dependent enzyme [Helicobacter sp. MIT 05-5294]
MIQDFFKPLLQNLPDDKESKREVLRQECILQTGFHHFDWTASGLAAQCVESRMRKILPFYANTHSTSNSHAELTSSLYEGARERLKKIFGLDSSFALIACGFGSSAAIKKFQELLGIYIPPKTKQVLGLDSSWNPSSLPLVIIGPYEHHSNELSFREGLCEVVRIGLDAQGLVDLESLKSILSANAGRKIIGSFALGSNVSGILAPFDKISHLIRSFGGIVCFDCASTSAYLDIPPSFYDAIFLSPHKLLGGIGGSGILIVSCALIDKTLPPTFCGGGVVGYVSRKSAQYYAQEQRREEAGTPGILEFLRSFLGYALREEIGQEWIRAAKIPYITQFREFLENEPKILSYGNLAHNELGIFSFNLRGISPFEVSYRLSKQYGILTRAGCSCAGPYGHDLLGLEDGEIFSQKPGWVRLNVHYTHTQEEINQLLSALKEIIRDS